MHKRGKKKKMNGKKRGLKPCLTAKQKKLPKALQQAILKKMKKKKNGKKKKGGKKKRSRG